MPPEAATRLTGQAPREGFRAIGRVERPWGRGGVLKVLPLTDFPERLTVGARFFLGGQARIVRHSRWQRGRVYLHIEGIEQVEQAEALRGELLEIPEEERPTFVEGQYYVDEIEGCTVRSSAGEVLGCVREVLQPGANDVFIVGRPGKRDLLIPAIRTVVLEVDLEERTLTVDLPEGLDPDASH